MADKEKIPGLAIAIMSKKKREEDEEIDKEIGADYEDMAKDILNAIEEKDSKALSEALKSFIEEC